MCGLTALVTNRLDTTQLNILQTLFLESTIRGLHAFGAAWGHPGERLQVYRTHHLTHLIADFPGELYLGQPFLFLGHARYDTSGDWRVLGNNQPLQWGSQLLVFNGVIRMSTQAEYEQEFHFTAPSDNDGHVFLSKAQAGLSEAQPLLDDPAVSFAGFYYDEEDQFALAIRNERRPLWRSQLPGLGWFYYSTRDMMVRTERTLGRLLPCAPEELHPQEVYPLWHTPIG